MLTKYSRFATIGKQMSGLRLVRERIYQPNRYQISRVNLYVEKKIYLHVKDLFPQLSGKREFLDKNTAIPIGQQNTTDLCLTGTTSSATFLRPNRFRFC
jgi:hypothetical protein